MSDEDSLVISSKSDARQPQLRRWGQNRVAGGPKSQLVGTLVPARS